MSQWPSSNYSEPAFRPGFAAYRPEGRGFKPESVYDENVALNTVMKA